MKRIITIVMWMLLPAVTFSANHAADRGRTPTPEIIVTQGYEETIVECVGVGEIFLYKDGVEVENPYTIVWTDEEQEYCFRAFALLDGYPMSEWVEEYVYVPAIVYPILPVEPNVDLNMTLMPEYVIIDPTLENYDIDFSIGSVYADCELLDSPYIFPRCNYDYFVYIIVELACDGLQSHWYEEDLIIPALEGDPHDVDFNGSVNIRDLTALINYLLTYDSTGINLGKADCNASGYINIDDVTELINYLLTENMP